MTLTSRILDSEGNILAVIPIEVADDLLLRVRAIEEGNPFIFPKRDSDGCLLKRIDKGRYERLYLPTTTLPIKDPMDAIEHGLDFATIKDSRRRIDRDIKALIELSGVRTGRIWTRYMHIFELH